MACVDGSFLLGKSGVFTSRSFNFGTAEKSIWCHLIIIIMTQPFHRALERCSLAGASKITRHFQGFFADVMLTLPDFSCSGLAEEKE